MVEVMAKRNAWISKVITARISFAILATSAVLAAIIGLTGCASEQAQIHNVTLSFNAVKTVVTKNLPGGIARESVNGRELTSGFFDTQTLKAENPKKPLKVRGYMVVNIFGNTRPYSMSVKVFTEQRGKDGWEPLGEDPELTDRLAERLRSALADRREDRNVIDDFKVF